MTLSKAAFERAVGRLDGDAARRFVADLLSARGYTTAVEGSVVVATSDSGTSMRVLVVDGLRDATVATHEPRADIVLSTGGTSADLLRSVVVRRARGGENRPTVLGVETLYEWFAYAVDGETRTALGDRYLGATEPSVFERAWMGVVAGGSRAAEGLERLPVPTRATVGVVVVALLALVAVTTAGPLPAFGPTSSSVSAPDGRASVTTPGITSVPVTVTPGPTPTDAGAPLPETCPPAPVDAHPASLRPGVIRTASDHGLDGWSLLITQNISQFEFDPNDQQLGLLPEERHVAVFETSGGMQFRLGLDRWESPAGAEAAVARGGTWDIGFPWGTYAVWVEWQSEAEGRESTARRLLAAVRTPGGVKLGGACVSALARATNTTA